MFLSGDAWALQLALWFEVLYEQCVKPKQEQIVLVDGGFYKYFARLCQNTSIDLPLLKSLLHYHNKCDEVILLKIDPAICRTRCKNFTLTEIAPYDDAPKDYQASFISYQSRIYQTFEELSKVFQWDTISCFNKSIEDLALDVAVRIEEAVLRSWISK